MTLPAGYFYKEGFYWRYDESGPYVYDGSSMSLAGIGAGSTIAWDTIVGATYTLDPNKPFVECTNFGGTVVTVPSGLGVRRQWLILQGVGAGPVQLASDGTSSLIPTSPSTLATSGVGQMIGVITTADGTFNKFAVSGATPSGPRFLNYYADYPALLADYAVGSGNISALNGGDYAWVNNYNLPFIPNVAKNRMVAQGQRIRLIELGGTLVNPIVAAITATGLVTISLPTLPAYLVQPGDFFEIWGLDRHTGTTSGTELQLKLGTANGAGDQTIAKTSTNSGNPQDGAMYQRVYAYDTTTAGATQTTIPNSSSSNVQNTPSPMAFNSLQYFNLYTQTLGAGDSLYLTQLIVDLVQKK